MKFFCFIFAVISLISVCECLSIIEQNDTALELLNNCKCVLKDHCYKGYINVRGVGIITLRNDAINQSETAETVEIQCTKPSFVCCKERKSESGSNFNTKLSLKLEEGNTTANTTGKGENLKKEKTKQRCGRSKSAINIRIHAGHDDIITAMDGEFPWLASIHKINQLDGSFKFRCGGSLINDIVVLTAAHCVYSSRKRPSELKIIANARKEIGKVGQRISEERDVKKILVHPDYYSAGAQNDIALIFLERSYNDSKDLNSICLPGSSSIFDRSRCITAGWGDGNGKIEDGVKILSKVELPIVDHESCQSLLRRTKLGSDFELHESSICAGGEVGKDACKGDGGGPLICPNDEGYFVQVGIVSWGVGCSKENQPGVYTSVEKFEEWINSNI